MDVLTLDRGAVQSAVEDIGLDFEETLTEGYRGRFESRPTWGLVFENETQADEFFANMSEFDHGVAIGLIQKARRDQLGRRLLVYFPGVELKLL